MTRVVDTHAHLEHHAYDADRDQVIDRAQGAGVLTIINVGTTTSSSRSAIELAQKYQHIFATVGTHPTDLEEKDSVDIKIMRQLASRPKVVAIGECGLDLSPNNSRPLDQQQHIFSLQIQLARERRLPIIIHCRQALDHIFPVLEKHPIPALETPGVFHCFTGTATNAQRLLSLGYYISFSGVLTYPKNQYLRDIASTVPLDKVVVETDSPFLPPQIKRGKRNEPLYILEVIKTLAAVRNVTEQAIANQTSQNADRLFRLKN